MACLWDIPDRAPSPIQEISIESYESPLETKLRNLIAMSESLKIKKYIIIFSFLRYFPPEINTCHSISRNELEKTRINR